MEKYPIWEILVCILAAGLVVCVIGGLLNSCGYFSKEETRIVVITDKWTDYNNNFYMVDNNDNVYKLLALGKIEYKSSTSYRYKQIILGNKYKLTVKTPYLVVDVLSFSEEEVV